MDVIFKNLFRKKIKFSLVFFCFLSCLNCKNSSNEVEIRVNYSEKKANSISFEGIANNIIHYKVFLKGNSSNAVLGKFTKLNNDSIIFTPIVDFENGNEYSLIYKDELVGKFAIKDVDNNSKPELIAIYPSKDTLPENLLKMYFVFSKPMQNVSNFLDFVTVKNSNTNKDEEVFLRLENELWNRNQTRITLWLDPGRIKTDLKPNEQLGLPIIEGNHYLLTVSDQFRDANGIKLAEKVVKKFYVSKKDDKMPLIEKWQLSKPEIDTKDVLKIDFVESLDAILAKESIKIIFNSKEISGQYFLRENESQLEFLPDSFWTKGVYKILVDRKLEDLAGNNLLRKFDVDLDNDKPNSKELITELEFIVE